jgi:hypothetical protein
MPRASRRSLRRLLSIAATAAVAVLCAAGSAASAHDGLDRSGDEQPGPVTAEAKAALAAFQQRASAGELATGAAADPVVGPGYVSSANVRFLRTLPQTTDGVGARVVGNRLFVTSTKDLQIFDITDPTVPQLLGQLAVNVEFENEQVPTDGKVLGISGQTPTVNTGGVCPGNVSLGCLAVYDVRGTAPRLVTTVPAAGDHTATCIEADGNTCAYTYGSAGTIVDLRQALATPGTATKVTANWQKSLRDRNFPIKSGHHQTQVRPGVLLTASIPSYLISVRPEDGGSVEAPAVLGKADFTGAPDDKQRFTHGVEWSRGGTDKIMLAGGETNFQPSCGATNGAFSTFRVAGTPQQPTFTFADQVRPKAGNFLDGNPPPGSFRLGCSVHWFEPHPTFHDQGVVALAAYENGTKFERIHPDGRIEEVGFFLPLGGSTSAPHWAPDGKTVYLIDYQRGLDIVQYTGPLFSADAGGPDATVPEAPYAVLLLAGSPALASVVVVLRRRRRA